MPCSDQPPAQPYRDDFSLYRRINRLASMLCWLCGKVESATPELIKENATLAEWWEEHKIHDALGKLSEDDKLKMAIEARSQETGSIHLSYTMTGDAEPD